MIDQLMTIPAQGGMGLITAYWICLIVGCGLLLISSLAGGDTDLDLDMDTDIRLDVDADVSVSADVNVDGHTAAGPASLASWFSMQFVVFFMAMFGLVGLTLTYLTGATPSVSFGCAALGGLVVGQGAHQILRKLQKGSGDSTTKPEDYVNKLARVTIAVANNRTGEVAVRVGRADRYVPAVAKHAKDSFDSGQQVGVVAYHNGVVDVVSREEYEFLNEKS